ncbi:MAG: aminotransferase class I/II-fold pyridoxal phosphate-dependent enzyme [Desulfoprunum sp.]|nr:aminotransferase class I/II-fold pyridoxal phosphate-dependent enzyme [Desulfoprunum sp.]
MKPRPFLLERYFAEHEFSAPYLLCCSDCESLSIKDLLQKEPEAHERFLSLRLGYTESLGSPELRQEIASLYRQSSPEHILVHAGAEEAIFNCMHATLEPGDTIIVHSPYYQSLGEVARSIGAEVIEWQADPGRSWTLDLDFLRDRLTSRMKMVVINVPHNPTGFLPGIEFITELSRLSDEHGFLIFSDEVYRGLEYDSAERLPALADINERAVSLGVMSKTYGLAGLRIGWIYTRNRSLFRELAAFKDYTTICNSAPSEFLATLALHHRDAIVARNMAIIRSNLVQLNAFFAAHTDLFQWHEPKAGPIAFPRYLGTSVAHFCRDLVEKAGVLLLPGTLYREDLDCFRIGFGRQNMADCLEKFEVFLHRSEK